MYIINIIVCLFLGASFLSFSSFQEDASIPLLEHEGQASQIKMGSASNEQSLSLPLSELRRVQSPLPSMHSPTREEHSSLASRMPLEETGTWALSPGDALISEWLSLEMGEKAEKRGLEVLGESLLGADMNGPYMHRYQHLPPFMPIWGAFRIANLFSPDQDNDHHALIPEMLLRLLKQIPAGHAIQILLYPAVWKQTYEVVPLVLHRPLKETDLNLPIHKFMDFFGQRTMQDLTSLLNRLSTKPKNIEFIFDLPAYLCGYVGQFLWYQPLALQKLPFRKTAMMKLLGLDRDNPFSMYLLAKSHVHLKNYSRAQEIYRALYDAGDGNAALAYAHLGQKKLGTPIGYWDVFKAFQFAATRGMPDAYFYAAKELTKWPLEDLEAARAFQERAAEKGYGPAILALGISYEHGTGGEKNLQKAEELYLRAAELGVKGAHYSVGQLNKALKTEEGDKKARQYYQAEVSNNPAHRAAILNLAYFLGTGRGGDVDQDQALALLLPLANDKENPSLQACHNVGAILQSRETVKDLNAAKRYFKRGADLGDRRSSYEYARMCLKGMGGRINLKEALKYAELSFTKGYRPAHSLLTSIKTMMQPKAHKKDPEKQPLLS